MLNELDKKLYNLINKKIHKEKRKKFNIFKSNSMSIGWIFATNIFVFIFIGSIINKYFYKNTSIFVPMILISIMLSFISIYNTIKQEFSTKKSDYLKKYRNNKK